MQHTPASSLLVRIADLSQDLTVGVGPATASVRTLTNVSLTVSAKELVVLSGARGAGERALLAVIAGDRRGVTGCCEVSVSARIRLMRIDCKPALALMQEWARATHFDSASTATIATRAPELFLLDVAATPVTSAVHESGRHPWNEEKRGQLLAWASLCRARGGAIVMAAGQALGESVFNHALVHQRPVVTRPVDKLTPPTHAPLASRAVFERATSTPAVRIVVMHSGRLAPAIRLEDHELIDR